ncbi:hypothetical protein ACJZ2D_007828 [Fusarium nematophilum]
MMAPLQEVDPNVRSPPAPVTSDKSDTPVEPDPQSPPVPPVLQKPGKPRKPYRDRKWHPKRPPKKPVDRVERPYSLEKKEEVLMWLIHHRVLIDGEWKPPSIYAAAWFRIKSRQIFKALHPETPSPMAGSIGS